MKLAYVILKRPCHSFRYSSSIWALKNSFTSFLTWVIPDELLPPHTKFWHLRSLAFLWSNLCQGYTPSSRSRLWGLFEIFSGWFYSLPDLKSSKQLWFLINILLLFLRYNLCCTSSIIKTANTVGAGIYLSLKRVIL